IEAWLFGVQTDPTRIDQSINRLQELMEKDAANADLPYAIARAMIKRGVESATFDRNAASKLFREASELFDKALISQGENAMMQWRAAQIYAMLERAETGKAGDYQFKSARAIERAVALVKPTDKTYVDVAMNAAQLALFRGDTAAAQKIYRDLLAAKPDDQSVRLATARLLASRPETRGEAIEILAKPFAAGEGLVGKRALFAHQLRAQTMLDLANLRIDAYAAAKTDAEREELMKKIQAGYDELINEIGDVPAVMKTRGKMQRVRNQPVEAIQTLSRAKQFYEQQPGFRELPDYYELVFLLAQSYYATNQTGEAKALLNQLVERFDKLPDARKMLAQLLARENNMTEARVHVEALKRLAPNDPDVVRLTIVTTDPKDKASLNKLFASLPEQTREEKLLKAQNAAQLDLPAEVERLLGVLIAGDPKDLVPVETLARYHMARGQKEKAVKVVGDAITRNPDNPALALLGDLVEGESPEAILPQQKELIEKITDPYVRELKLYQLAAATGDREGALRHLQAAKAHKPQDPQVLDLLFAYHLQARQFDEAAKYVEPLAAANRDQAGGLLYRYRLAQARGDDDAALSAARDLTQKLPEFAQSWLALGQALSGAGQYDQALQKYTLALEKQSGNLEAYHGVIDCYYRLNRPDDAKRYIAQGRQTFPNEQLFKELEVNHELIHGDPEKALPAREAAMRANPEQPAAWLNLGNAYLRTAQVKGWKNDEEAAKKYLAKAREVYAQALAKWPDERAFYGNLAEVALLSGDVPAAEKVLKDFAVRDAWKDKPDPYRMLGDFHARVGRADDAGTALTAAFEKSGKNVEAQQHLAHFLATGGKVDEALAVLDSANTSDARVQRQRIEVQINGGRHEAAEKTLLASLEKSPNDPGLLTLLSVVYMNTQRFDQAMERLNAAIGVDARNTNALYYRGLVHLQQAKPDPEAAIRDLAIVREVEPSNADARFWMSEALRRKGDSDNAVRELAETLKIVPLNKMVRMKLIDLCATHNPPRWGDAERLITEAKGMAAFQSDADWDAAEARMWLARGDSKKAVSSISRARKLAPADPGILQTFLTTLVRAKQYRPVLEETDKLIARDAKNVPWWVYQARGVAKRFLGDKEGALAELTAGMELAASQRNDDAVSMLVTTTANEIGIDAALDRIAERAKTEPRWQLVSTYLLHAKGDHPGAIAMAERVTGNLAALSPNDQIAALRFTGTLYLSAKPPQNDKAVATYPKVLERQPEDLASLNNLACLLAEHVSPPRPEQALVYSKKAYEVMRRQGRNEPLIYDTHGWVLTLAGEVDEGINLLRELVDRNPFPDAHYHLGEAYLKRSYPEEAVTQFRAAKKAIEEAEQKKQPID
ncbi:MAG: tetratricopeptide repeat protein, partial [Tepidisphaeraceae bacterium]